MGALAAALNEQHLVCHRGGRERPN
jgi:hypothetical protein